jgi:hypothetical protein
MGIENVDGTDVTSIRKAMEFVKLADSPYHDPQPCSHRDGVEQEVGVPLLGMVVHLLVVAVVPRDLKHGSAKVVAQLQSFGHHLPSSLAHGWVGTTRANTPMYR